MGSLRLRLLLSVGLLLTVFFGIAIAVLESAFRDAAMQSAEARLDVQLIALLAAAEPADDERLDMPDDFREPRFSAPGSGLYAAIRDGDGETVWESRSTLGVVVPWIAGVDIGARRFDRIRLVDGTPLLSFTLGVDWEFSSGRTRAFTFHVAEDENALNAQVAAFRRQLFVWFGAAAIGLIVSLGLLLGWLLRPLAKIEDEIEAIELGERDELSAGYPSELTGVQQNLNALIARERSRSEVYRRTLGDLAHSLKTPLATLRTLLARQPGNSDIDVQLERMDELIRYQLAKPATRGRLIGTRPFAVIDKLEQLMVSFAKIYHDRDIDTALNVEDGLSFRGDSGDFTELAGNLIDNAFKRTRHAVAVTARRERDGGFILRVDDDGPGFPPGAEARVLDRGTRLDESDGSQGIGLAIVAEICELYGATLTLGESQLGGARVTVRIPNP